MLDEYSRYPWNTCALMLEFLGQRDPDPRGPQYAEGCVLVEEKQPEEVDAHGYGGHQTKPYSHGKRGVVQTAESQDASVPALGHLPQVGDRKWCGASVLRLRVLSFHLAGDVTDDMAVTGLSGGILFVVDWNTVLSLVFA